MNMVERCARVLAVQFEHEHKDAWQIFMPAARAVLKELREPTEEMLWAAIGHIVGDEEQERQIREDKNTWQVMAKAALEE